MTSRAVGACPDCQAAVPRDATLIQYERAGGNPGVYAACPACGDVVQPI